MGRKTDKADRQTLNLCAEHLRRLNSLTYAAEMYKYVYYSLFYLNTGKLGPSLIVTYVIVSVEFSDKKQLTVDTILAENLCCYIMFLM